MKMHGMEHKIWASVSFFILVYFVEYYYHIINLPFWVGWLLVILGAYMPDIDLDFGTKYHRSFWTHGPLIPLFFAIMYGLTPSWLTLSLLGFFFMGYASHLLLDIFPSNSSLFKMVWSLFATYQTPGDIRSIPEWFERPWLGGSGIYVIVLAILFFSSSWNLLTIGFTYVWFATIVIGIIWTGLGVSIYFKHNKKKKRRGSRRRESDSG